jgi:hypothetical protein
MSLNLDAVLRLVFKTEGTEAITKVQTAWAVWSKRWGVHGRLLAMW